MIGSVFTICFFRLSLISEMIWISLFETLLLAAVIPAVLANRHQNRSDGKWKLHENHRAHEVLQDSSSALLPGSSNHSYAISQRISSENKSNDEWQHGNPESEVTCEEARLKCAYRVGCGMALQVSLNPQSLNSEEVI